jgi:hypothetical protein
VRWLLPGLALLLTSACAGTSVAGAPVPAENPVSAPAKTDRPSSRSRPPVRLSSVAPAPRPPADLNGLVGVWEGEYTCAQGLTGLKLTVEAPSGNSLPAVFDFYPLPSNPNVPKGSFSMAGSLTANGQLVFKQQKWINQPPGYLMTDLAVTSPITAGVKKLSGDILLSACKGFSVRRS